MTDMVTGSDQGQDTSAPVSQPVNNTSVSHESNHKASSEEKLFRQSELNEIVGRAKQEAIERYKRSHDVSNQQQHSINQQPSRDEIRQLAAEEAQRLRDQWVQDAHRSAQEQDAQRIANEFFTKLSTGKEKYQDFEKTVSDLEFTQIPHIVQLANMVDNTSDVMYELAKHPSKIATLQQLIGISNKLAYNEMLRLSQSIKENDAATQAKLPNEPLSKLRPTNTGTDNGQMSVRDYRSKYRV